MGYSERLDDDLIAVEDARLSGTCEWFSAKTNHKKWRDFAPDAPGILWVNGKSAAGKSVLAGFVIGQLQRMDADCSYFFFKYGDKSKSRLSSCLRSLAFQMACKNPQVREMLLEMQKDDIKLDGDNERIIWRKLFYPGSFKQSSRGITGSLMAKLDESTPLRILITSRETPELDRHFSTLSTHRFRSEVISVTDTGHRVYLPVSQRRRPN